MTHRGQIIEKIIRRSGYSLTKLAEKLGITRNTLYNKFKKANLNYRFIIRVGNIIKYDFSYDFPEIKNHPDLMAQNALLVSGKEDMSAHLWRAEDRYTRLLERYNNLLQLLLRLAGKNGFQADMQTIIKLIGEESMPVNKGDL